MNPPLRARALVWVRLAALPVLLGMAVIVGSTPDPVSDVPMRVRSIGSAPPTPAPPTVLDELAVRRGPQPTTTTTAPPPPTPAPVAPRRPTATIAPQPRPRAPAAAQGAGVERWRSLVAGLSPPWPTPQGFRWNVDTMLRIIRCESGGDPTNWEGKSRGVPWSRNRASGLFQHLPAPAGWEDPFVSTTLAYSKWSTRGLQPWACA